MLNEHDDIKAYAKLQSDAIDKHLKIMKTIEDRRNETNHKHRHDSLSSLWYELIQTLITKEEKQTMTTEQTLKVLEAMKAGKEILISDKTERPPHDGMWSGLNYDTKNLKLDTERYLYKVAPEYRPYNKNELDSLLGGVIRKKYDAASIHLITGVDKTNGRICVSEIWMTTNVLFEKYLYRNETPLGMEIK